MVTALDESPTIFVVDDDPVVCRSVEALAASIKLRAESFTTAESFLASLASGPRAGCVVLDERLPGASGLEVQRQLLAADSTLPVVVVSAFANVPMAVQAMKHGALGVIEKPYQDEELLEAILDGIRVNAAERQRRQRCQQGKARLERLTTGEDEVLRLILEGCSNKVIAGKLGVSLRTVENRRSGIFTKTETKSVAELVRFVVEFRHNC